MPFRLALSESKNKNNSKIRGKKETANVEKQKKKNGGISLEHEQQVA